MAKFVELTGYFIGYSKTPTKRFINTGKIRWVIKNPSDATQTYLCFDNEYVLVMESKVEDVIKRISE